MHCLIHCPRPSSAKGACSKDTPGHGTCSLCRRVVVRSEMLVALRSSCRNAMTLVDMVSKRQFGRRARLCHLSGSFACVARVGRIISAFLRAPPFDRQRTCVSRYLFGAAPFFSLVCVSKVVSTCRRCFELDLLASFAFSRWHSLVAHRLTTGSQPVAQSGALALHRPARIGTSSRGSLLRVLGVACRSARHAEDALVHLHCVYASLSLASCCAPSS